MASVAWTQTRYRIRADDGSETSATWLVAEDTSANSCKGKTYRIRIQIAETGGKSWSGQVFNLYYAVSVAGSTYTQVTTSTSVKLISSSYFVDGDDCTRQLTAPAGSFVTDNNGMKEATGGVTNSGAAGNFFETEWCVYVDLPDLQEATSILFRVYSGTTALSSYTRTATLINKIPTTSTPTIISPDDLASLSSGTPSLNFKTTDPDFGSDIQYNIQIDTNNYFTSQPGTPGDFYLDQTAPANIFDCNLRAGAVAISGDGTKVLIGTWYNGTGTYGGLYFSSNRGKTWTNVSPIASVDCKWDTVHISDDGNYLAAGQSAGYLYISSDDGENWSAKSPGGWWSIGHKDITMSADGQYMLIVATATSNQWLVALSSNYGSTWSTLNPGMVNPELLFGGIISADGNVIVLNSQKEVFISTNRGTNWSAITPYTTGDGYYRRAGIISNGEKIIMGMGGGDYKIRLTENYGSSWSDITPSGLPATMFWYYIRTSRNGSVLMASASTSSNPITVSKDIGQTWSYHRGNDWDMFDMSTDGTLYVCGRNGSVPVVFGEARRPLIYRLSNTHAGFENVDTPADISPFNSGDEIKYTVQSADILDNGTYYWRVRGICN